MQKRFALSEGPVLDKATVTYGTERDPHGVALPPASQPGVATKLYVGVRRDERLDSPSRRWYGTARHGTGQVRARGRSGWLRRRRSEGSIFHG